MLNQILNKNLRYEKQTIKKEYNSNIAKLLGKKLFNTAIEYSI